MTTCMEKCFQSELDTYAEVKETWASSQVEFMCIISIIKHIRTLYDMVSQEEAEMKWSYDCLISIFARPLKLYE